VNWKIYVTTITPFYLAIHTSYTRSSCLPSIHPSVLSSIHPSIHPFGHPSNHPSTHRRQYFRLLFSFICSLYTWFSHTGIYFCQIEPMFFYRRKRFPSMRELNRIRIYETKWPLSLYCYLNCENNNINDNKTARSYLHCVRFLLTVQYFVELISTSLCKEEVNILLPLGRVARYFATNLSRLMLIAQ